MSSKKKIQENPLDDVGGNFPVDVNGIEKPIKRKKTTAAAENEAAASIGKAAASKTEPQADQPTESAPIDDVKKVDPKPAVWQTILSWGVTFLIVAALIMLLLKFNPFDNGKVEASTNLSNTPSDIELPAYTVSTPVYSLPRVLDINTSIADDKRQFPVKYTIEQGDSIFSIAKKFGIQPTTVLWANNDLLKDDPTFLSPGWKLTIPPTDGIYYKWKEGDTLQKVAEKYYADVDDIINWPGNGLDVENPETDNLEYIMIPGGYREIQSWIVPVAYSPRSGATRVVAGPGGCQAPAVGLVGSGGFIWPAVNHVLSGWDFTSYHLGIDIASGEGSPVYAADSGTVIYAGWNDSGYGYMVMIDHNNGYTTLYGHLSSLATSCGSDVYQGSIIGYSGNTGRSEGAHLHFEIRLNGGFVNPWQVLP